MKHQKLVQEITTNVGGESNILSIVHCATRLRFSLEDITKAKKMELEKVNGVLKVIESGGQIQVVIGDHVDEVYKELTETIHLSGDSKTVNNKQSISARLFSLISGSFSPLIPMLAGAGVLKAFLTLFVTMSWLNSASGTYIILSAAANAVFYFLPIMLGFTIAVKVGANPYVGATIGAALLEPSFTALIDSTELVTFLGIVVKATNFSTTVFPIFLAVLLLGVLEKALKKYVPPAIKLFFIPMISLVIIVPFTILVFGPFSQIFSQLIFQTVTSLINLNPMVAGMFLGGFWLLIVALGLHWALIPVIIGNIMAGGDPIVALVAPCVGAALGVALGVLLKTKDRDLKSLAGSSFVSGVFSGVVEPILYGILFKYRKALYFSMIAGSVGGLLMGLFGVKLVQFAFFVNLFTIPAFTPIIPYIISLLVSMTIGVVLVFVLGYEDKKKLI